MIDWLNTIDTQVFLALNGLHAPYFDVFMKLFTGKWIWVPMYAAVLFANRKLSLFIFAWAVLNSYSRVYLGVHYPGDLFVGMLIGLITATASYYVFRYFARNYTDKFKPGGIQLKYQRYPIYTGLISIWVWSHRSGHLRWL